MIDFKKKSIMPKKYKNNFQIKFFGIFVVCIFMRMLLQINSMVHFSKVKTIGLKTLTNAYSQSFLI